MQKKPQELHLTGSRVPPTMRAKMAAPLTKQTSPQSNATPKATERTTAEQQPLEYTQNAILLRGDWAYLHLYLHLIKCVNVNMIIVLIGHSPKYKIYNNAIICQLNISGED